MNGIDETTEAKFWQDYLDNEDAELDRINNAIWPGEIAVILAVLLIGVLIYYFFG